jgi:hypothetical protein
VRSIASGLGTPNFADIAALRLCPAPQPAPRELNVFATMDWVLFHRRRDKTCQVDKPALPLAVRRYALYHIQLTGDQTVADLKRLLERTTTSTKMPALNFVQLVEFGAGIHAVVSPHSQVQASWRGDVGNDAGNVIGGLIASHGIAASEGERLAQERVESLGEVIEPIHPPGVTRTFDVLARVPDPLNAASNDGVIIMATTKPQAKINAHAIYHFNTQRDAEFRLLLQAAVSNDQPTFVRILSLGTLLGVVNFTDGTTQPTDNALDTIVARWNAETDGKVLAAEIIYPKQLDDIAYEQGKKQVFDEAAFVGNKLGTPSQQAYSPGATTLALPQGAHAITVFLAASVANG